MKLIMKFIIELVFLYWFSMDFYKYFKLDNKILSIIFLLATREGHADIKLDFNNQDSFYFG